MGAPANPDKTTRAGSFPYQQKLEAYQSIAELGMKAIGSQACTLLLVDLKERKLLLAASSGFGLEETRRNVGRTFTIGSYENGDVFDYNLIAAGEAVEKCDLQQNGLGFVSLEIARKYNINALLALPLKSEKGVLGYLCHFSSTTKSFSPGQRRLLTDQILVAREIQEKYSDLDPLLEIVDTLPPGLLLSAPDVFIRQVASGACNLLSVPICIVWLIDEDRKRLRIKATHGNVDEEFQKLTLDLNDPRIRSHVATREIAFLEDLKRPHPNFAHRQEATVRGWKSLLTAPMFVGSRSIGMLDIYTEQPRRFTALEKRVFRVFASHAALSIQKTELFAEFDSAESGLMNTLRLIVKRCVAAAGADACTIQLFGRDNESLEQSAEFQHPNLGCEGASGIPAVPAEILESVLKTGKPVANDQSIFLPVKAGHEVIGILFVSSNTKGGFGVEQQQVLENVLDGAQAAIARASLRDGLLRIARTMTEAESLDGFLCDLAQVTRDLMREPICLVWKLDKNRNGFVLHHAVLPRGRVVERLHDLFIPSGHPYVTDFSTDEPRDSATEEHIREVGGNSALAMPLRVDGRIAGILEVCSSMEMSEFTSWGRSLFKTIALQASLAVKNIISRTAFTELNRAFRAMTSTTAEMDLLDSTLQAALSLTGSSRGWISRYREHNGTLEIAVASGNPRQRSPLKLGQGITGLALQDKRPFRVADVKAEEWSSNYEQFWDDTRSELAVPILIENAEIREGTELRPAAKPIAVLNIESPTVAAFSDFEEHCVWSLAQHAAINLESAEFDAKLKKLHQAEALILSNSDFESAIELLLRAITDTLGYEWVNISLISEDQEMIQTKYSRGVSEEEKEIFAKMAGHRLDSNDIQADIVRSRQIEVPDQFDSRFDWAIFERFGHKDWIRVYMPMIRGSSNRVIGTVEAGYRRAFRKHIYERDVQVLKGFIDYATAALEQTRRGLLDKVGHQVKMPISGIRNNASFLRQRWHKLSPEKIAIKLDDILADTEILRHQAAQLDFVLGGRIPASKPTWTILIRDVIVKTLNQLKPEIIGKGFSSYQISYPDVHRVRVLVDKIKVSEVVYNLVMNAIKYTNPQYTEPRGKFTLDIQVEEDDSNFLVKFLDWGMGVSAGLEEKIFEEGFRAPEAERIEVSGSGLGLNISRRYMREMGGDLILKKRGRPTEFHMIVPKREPKDCS